MGAMLLPPLPSNVASLSAVRFYPNEDHSGTGMVEVPTVTDLDTGEITVETGTLNAGRWYPVLVGLDPADAEITYTPATLTYVDLPYDDTLAVSPEHLAVEAGMSLPLTAAQRQTITTALRDAQSDVYAYLGRVILPTVKVENGLWPYPGGWDLATDDDPLIRVLSVEAELSPYEPHEATGYFTVTYLAGIDCRLPEYDPIMRYLIAHTLNSERFRQMWATVTKAKGTVKSLSAEGQSVSFDKPTLGRTDAGRPGDLLPGSLPDAASMDRWRIRGRRVYQAPSRVTNWPFSGARW